MWISGRDPLLPRAKNREYALLLVAALVSEIITGGLAFFMPVGFTSVHRIENISYQSERSSGSNDQFNVQNNRKYTSKSLRAIDYYGDEDQWRDDPNFVHDSLTNISNEDIQELNEPKYEGAKRALLGGAALGTMMAINNAVGMTAGAETATAVGPPASDGASKHYTESYSAVLNTQPEVSLPYLEKQIQAAEEALANQADLHGSSKSVLVGTEMASSSSDSATQSAAVGATAFDDSATLGLRTSTTVAAAPTLKSNVAESTTSQTNAASSPSFVRYTQEHMPGWIETGQKIYDAAAPKVVAGAESILAEVDRRVTPMVIEKEHELLGEENSAVLDETLSSVASAGKVIAGMVGQVISFGVEGGVEVIKATPKVIAAGEQVYRTMDEKIFPEVVQTSQKMKSIVDKTVPEIMETGKHAYDTIMPEVVNAEKQVASTVMSGVDMAMPTVKEIEHKVVPELSKFERDVFGVEGAAMVDKTVSEVADQGRSVFQTVEKTIPQVWASGQSTVETVANTGRSVARAVPVVIESGKQAYDSIDRSISNAISTTQDIAGDLDRAAGKTAYVLEDNLNGMTGTIDKTLPVILEAGRQAAVSGSELAKNVESGGKAVIEDISGFVDDRKVDNVINGAGERLASAKPVFREITASVNDPNQLGKL